MDARFEASDQRFVQSAARFAQIDVHFAQMEGAFTARFAALENLIVERSAALERSVAAVDGRIDVLATRLAGLEARVDGLPTYKWLITALLTAAGLTISMITLGLAALTFAGGG